MYNYYLTNSIKEITKSILIIVIISINLKCSKKIQVPFHNPEETDNYFSIVLLPDTQYYTAEIHGGTKEMFKNQINWILNNITKKKIAYIVHLGDMTDTNSKDEWEIGKEIMQPLFDQNIPFGVAIGNHDETPYNKSSKGNENTLYNKYFGKQFFVEKDWYGGSITNNNSNDNHFDLITVKDTKLIIIYNDYNQPDTKLYDSSYEKKVLIWDDSLLTKYSDRKAIFVSHSLLRAPNQSTTIKIENRNYTFQTSKFSPEGELIHEVAQKHKNVFLMLCGHAAGESFRIDTVDHPIKTILSDYQFENYGGNGKMRLLTINITKQTMNITTFIPRPDGGTYNYTDLNSQYELPLF